MIFCSILDSLRLVFDPDIVRTHLRSLGVALFGALHIREHSLFLGHIIRNEGEHYYFDDYSVGYNFRDLEAENGGLIVLQGFIRSD